ncbi:MAG: hypothetical protein ACI82N_001147, partial [Maricaulis sp.]
MIVSNVLLGRFIVRSGQLHVSLRARQFKASRSGKPTCKRARRFHRALAVHCECPALADQFGTGEEIGDLFGSGL